MTARATRMLAGASLLFWAGVAQAAERSCAASAHASWIAAGAGYRIEAASSGTGCGIANVMLRVRAPGGAVLLRFTSAAADLPLVFARATTPAAMRDSLVRWIAGPAAAATTRRLPEWRQGADEPGSREVPFHPEPAFDRTRYAELRRWGQPLFCFVQDAGRRACYALDPKAGRLTLIGTEGLAG